MFKQYHLVNPIINKTQRFQINPIAMPSLSYWRLTLVLFTMGMVWMCTTTDVTDFSNEHESCVFVVIPVLFPISVAPLVNVPPFFFSLTVSLNFIHSKIHMVHTIISPLSGSITHGFAKHFPSQCIPSFHHRRKWSPGFSFFFSSVWQMTEYENLIILNLTPPPVS